MPIPSITFRVEANLLNDFKLVAKSNNRTATMLVRDFMLAYLKDDGEVWALNLLSDFNDVNEKGFDDKLSVKASKDLIPPFKIRLKPMSMCIVRLCGVPFVSILLICTNIVHTR